MLPSSPPLEMGANNVSLRWSMILSTTEKHMGKATTLSRLPHSGQGIGSIAYDCYDWGRTELVV